MEVALLIAAYKNDLLEMKRILAADNWPKHFMKVATRTLPIASLAYLISVDAVADADKAKCSDFLNPKYFQAFSRVYCLRSNKSEDNELFKAAMAVENSKAMTLIWNLAVGKKRSLYWIISVYPSEFLMEWMDDMGVLPQNKLAPESWRANWINMPTVPGDLTYLYRLTAQSKIVAANCIRRKKELLKGPLMIDQNKGRPNVLRFVRQRDQLCATRGFISVQACTRGSYTNVRYLQL
jgi:hypothetical protein